MCDARGGVAGERERRKERQGEKEREGGSAEVSETSGEICREQEQGEQAKVNGEEATLNTEPTTSRETQRERVGR